MVVINHETYVSLEVAKLLKEAGFDWELNSRWQDWGGKNSHEFILKTDLFYTDRPAEYDGFHALPAPTLDIAQRWLREVKGVEICVVPSRFKTKFKYPVYIIKLKGNANYLVDTDRHTIYFDTYESAQEAGIKKCLNNDFTTIEQTKELLELGVPSYSANCYIDLFASTDDNCIYGICERGYYDDYYQEKEGFIPAWSSGKLIEIYEKCVIKHQNEIANVLTKFERNPYHYSSIVEDVINQLIGRKIMADMYPNEYELNFSKLEEPYEQ